MARSRAGHIPGTFAATSTQPPDVARTALSHLMVDTADEFPRLMPSYQQKVLGGAGGTGRSASDRNVLRILWRAVDLQPPRSPAPRFPAPPPPPPPTSHLP